MSDKQLYISCWFPSEQIIEENGARRVAYSFYAANEKQARAKAILHFIEQYPDANDADFALKIYNHAEGIPCPAPEVWNENFLYKHEWDEDQGHPIQKVHAKPVYFYKLPSPLRVAVLVKYHTPEITSDQLAGAVELQHLSSSFDSHIADAISKTPAVAAMYPEHILESIDYIRENCSPTKKWPEIKAVLANWLRQREQDSKEEAGRTESISASKVVPRSYERTYKTLDLEIATALRAGDVDPNAPLSSITRWANGIIQEECEDWKRWSMQLRTQPNTLKYDRPTIFDVVRNVPSPETYKFPESHGRYITDYLATHGKMENPSNETRQDTASTIGVLANEQTAVNSVVQDQSDAEIATESVESEP